MRAESGINLRPNRCHTAISVTLLKPALMQAKKLKSEPNHIALYSLKLSLSALSFLPSDYV